MTKRLLILCGIPGAGKSTLARHLADAHGAVTFASEQFATELGEAARTPQGDLTKEAIAYAYDAMGATVLKALMSQHDFVVAVGSFRSLALRKRFRAIAAACSADATTVRITCPIELAAQRITARLTERGPDIAKLREIETAFADATDIDLCVANDALIETLYQRGDELCNDCLARH